ncbi:MAG: SRPBCC family protein [Bacteroidota bacterium]
MKLNFNKEITVDISSQKAWELLAGKYECVGDWATIIPESSPQRRESELVGRTCSSTYGDVQEMITHWDEENMTYSYEADGLPSLFKSGKNVWQVKATGDRSCIVSMRLNMEIAALPGFFMGWMLRSKMNKDLDGLMEDLKHYAEKGVPHPKKLRSLEKWQKHKAKKAA